MKLCKKERLTFSRFFYRFSSGESGADVYDRVSSFMESLFRLFHRESDKDFNLIIVSHGLTIRVILMRWFRWTVQEFETMVNPRNANPLVMERKKNSKRKFKLTPESWNMLHSYTYGPGAQNNGNEKDPAATEDIPLRFRARRQSATRSNLFDILNSDTETD